jgi:hypothetical protein
MAPVEETGLPRQAAGLPAPAEKGASADAARLPDADLESIRGSMTLRQVEQSTGVPVGALIEQLGLPSGIDPDERIGRIRKGYDVSPDDVRQAVRALRERQ